MARTGEGAGQRPSEIRRDIAETRQEIDTHLQELGGRAERVQSSLDISQQARRNLPQVLWGAAIAGLALGVLFGRGRQKRKVRLQVVEEPHFGRRLRRLARERGGAPEAFTLAEAEGEPDVP